MPYYPRILILSSRFGVGHFVAGEAMAEEFRSFLCGFGEIRHIDYGSFFFKKTDLFMRTAYMKMIKNTPMLWGKLYKHTQEASADNKLRTFINGLGQKSLINYLEDSRPDVIICTHFLPAGVLAEFKRKGIINIPLVSVVTDYIAHGMWIHPDIDLYLVGCQEIVQQLRERGIDSGKISLCGIPVRPRFEIPLKKEEMRKKLGMDLKKHTILLMGGGHGLMGDIKLMRQTLIDIKPELAVQLIVVCGNNQSLYYEFKSLAEESSVPITCYGYVENVEELMAAADILITKGGALTISEALTRNLPIIVFKPIPGQENGNAEFIENSGAGITVNDHYELKKKIEHLLLHQEKLQKMSTIAKKIIPRDTAAKAVRIVLDSLRDEDAYTTDDYAPDHSWKTG